MVFSPCLVGYERRLSVPNPRNAQDLVSELNDKKNKAFHQPCLGSPQRSKRHSGVAVRRQIVLITWVLGHVSPFQQGSIRSLCLSCNTASSFIICLPLRLYTVMPKRETIGSIVMWGLVILYMLVFQAVYIFKVFVSE